MEVNRSAAMVKDDWSVSTHAPGGIARRAAAMAAGRTLGVKVASERAWVTANTTATRAARLTAIHRFPSSIPEPLRGMRIATSSLDAGKASARASHGARNAGSGRRSPGAT